MKKLRITNPQITSYGGIANMLSILESYSETYSWIYSNFVQMIYYQNKDGDYLHNMTGSLYELETGLKYLPLYTYCPYFYVRSLSKDILFINENIIHYIINLLDNEYYFIGWINFFFIKASRNYNQINLEDGVLVYGYNLTHQILYCSGFVDGHYKQFETSFNEFKDAIYNEYEDNLYTKNISLIKYDKTYKHTFSKHELYSYVYDYLYSQDHNKKFSFITDKNYWYGISYYDKVNEQFCNHNKDMRLIHNLVDHKIMMKNRLKFLYSKQEISCENYGHLMNLNSTMYENLLILRNKTIKNNIRYNNEWPKNEIEAFSIRLNQVKDNDVAFCQSFLNILTK